MNKPLPPAETKASPAERKPLPPMVQFKHELERIAAELPASNDIPIERMKSAIIVAVQKNPDLLKADRATLWQSARSCAADGLLPDGREAAFVTYGGAVQYLPMIGGIYKRMRNSGQVKHIRAEIVCANDEFAVWIDEATAERRFRHNYNVFASMEQRGEPIGAYAVAGLADGTIEFEPMGASDIDRVRRVSRSQKGPQPSGVWQQWWDQMWKKTVIRRLSKRLPVSSDDVRFLDRSEDGQVIDEQAIADAPPAPVVERRSKQVAYVEDDEPEIVEAPAHDPETGEVEDAEVVTGPDDATKSVVDRIVSDFGDCTDANEVGSVMDLWRDQVEQIGAAWPEGRKMILEAADAARERVA